MKDDDLGNNQGRPRQGDTSKPQGKPPREGGQGEPGNRRPDKPDARPTPSGVPNEGLKANQTLSRDGQGGMQTPAKRGEG